VLLVFISFFLWKKQLLINGITPPEKDGHGRFFPYKESGPHFVGPISFNNKVYIGKIWQNTAENGRQYLRLVIEDMIESENC
jgi:hypothetical protein